ncbi:hypothetical protein Lalb_Chr07g0184951 [Lupinus albus]|uniref:Uncharacterized protein n=1 Tax=Lupinus albus TaxID=3870 RepID=A0A6A4Q9M7_LUPAL|nr:hypothetical protein Lalb_Chr07g0184951 [Lupinus albus]
MLSPLLSYLYKFTSLTTIAFYFIIIHTYMSLFSLLPFSTFAAFLAFLAFSLNPFFLKSESFL